ncbi:MAG: formate/nitrite transporter family protein [Mycobacterium sp.]|nr:formate/nitrite transporter family protein [Mycobacterium sp.]
MADQVETHDDGQPREQDLDEALDRIVEAGLPRLHRAWPDLLATGTIAGIEVGLGVLALLVVEHATGSSLLAGLAFSVGFVALLLGRSELFTEGFLVPITVVVAKHATVGQLLRLWAGTLVGNLAGGWVVTWLIIHGLPSLRAQAVESARPFAEAPLGLRAFCLAVLAGAAITLLTRMQNGTEDDVAKLLAAVVTAFVIVGTGLFHSVLDSLLVFAALHTGRFPFGYAGLLGWFAWTVLGNLVGGVGLTTLLRLVRSRRQLVEHREAR